MTLVNSFLFSSCPRGAVDSGVGAPHALGIETGDVSAPGGPQGLVSITVNVLDGNARRIRRGTEAFTRIDFYLRGPDGQNGAMLQTSRALAGRSAMILERPQVGEEQLALNIEAPQLLPQVAKTGVVVEAETESSRCPARAIYRLAGLDPAQQVDGPDCLRLQLVGQPESCPSYGRAQNLLVAEVDAFVGVAADFSGARASLKIEDSGVSIKTAAEGAASTVAGIFRGWSVFIDAPVLKRQGTGNVTVSVEGHENLTSATDWKLAVGKASAADSFRAQFTA